MEIYSRFQVNEVQAEIQNSNRIRLSLLPPAQLVSEVVRVSVSVVEPLPPAVSLPKIYPLGKNWKGNENMAG